MHTCLTLSLAILALCWPTAVATSVPCVAVPEPGCVASDAPSSSWMDPLAPSLCTGSSPGWDLVWEDNFDGTSINPSNWNVAHNFTHGDKELQLYLRDDVYVASGNLVLRTRRNPTMYGSKLYNWTSGWVDTMHKAYSPFGRFEIRARLPDPKSKRIWPAHWLMPEPDTAHPPNVCWPVGGEIDILESYGTMDNNTAQGTFHFATECNADLRAGPNGRFPNISGGAKEIDFSQDYHVFAVEWDTNCIKWFVDDNLYWRRWTNDQPAPHGARIPQTPMYVILNTAISWWGPSSLEDNSVGGMGGGVGADVGFDPLMPVYHYIDHVRIFRPKA